MQRGSKTKVCPAVSPTLCGLQGVHFGVFGLGNKQYEHFNAVGKRMQKNMQALGATPICPRGDGDDDDNIGKQPQRGCGAGRGVDSPRHPLHARVCVCLACSSVSCRCVLTRTSCRRIAGHSGG
jgi:hypothetical protein